MKLIKMDDRFYKLICNCGTETHFICPKKLGKFSEDYIFRCIVCGKPAVIPSKQLSLFEGDYM